MTNEQNNEIVETIELKLTKAGKERLRDLIGIAVLTQTDGRLVDAWRRVLDSIEKGEESITLNTGKK